MKKSQLSSIIQAAVLAFILMFVFQHFFGKRTERRKEPVKREVGVSIPLSSAGEGRVVEVDTPLYRAKFSTVNGKLISFYVKKYGAELVSGELLKRGISPFMTVSENRTLSEELSAVSMEPSSYSLRVEGSERKLIFRGKLKDGEVFVKEFTFFPRSYRIALSQRLDGKRLSVAIPDIRVNEAHTSRMGHIGPVVEVKGGKVERLKREEAKAVSIPDSRWAGQEDKYFIVAVKDSSFRTQVLPLGNATVILASLNNCTLYAGPKEISRLSRIGMEKAIDFGVFSILAKPFLKFFLFIHGFVPNYGLVIILLTILIKILLHPLTHKSFESMKKMQKLAPKLEELKKRYKDDPKRLNEEMMRLYRKEGVNPMGGCLPMLLQIPVFFALYEIFLNAVELKGSPFLWISDLSQADPTYILPVLMGASMILQQKLTPSTNPQQEKIFIVMAVVFTFMFATFPAGLVLYWFTNNLITALQNFIINRMIVRKG